MSEKQQSAPFAWLDFAVGTVTIAQLLLTGTVIILSREWRGTKRGSCLDARARKTAYGTSLVLFGCCCASAALIMWRLVCHPQDLGNKDELSITAAALGVLWWSDILCIRPSIRRRRRVATMLACVPTFRFGRSGYNSPTSPVFREAEFVVRSANWHLRADTCRGGRPPQDYWRGKVARVFTSYTAGPGEGCSIVVLYDETTQDEAGAELLTPDFTHKPELSKREVAHVIWRTLLRCGPWNIHGWERGFSTEIVCTLVAVSAVRGMRHGELAQELQNWGRARGVRPDSTGNGGLSEEDSHELCHILWAAITVEVLDHLVTGRKLVVLPVISKLALYVTGPDWNTHDILQACANFRDLRI